MIVADTSAVLALLNRDDTHHEALLRWYDEDGQDWLLPWAILPEVDYLLDARVGQAAALAFLADVADGSYIVEWGVPDDLTRAVDLVRRHRGLRLGFVDGVVMAVAERLRADAIATLDLRHFGAVKLAIEPLLLPQDG